MLRFVRILLACLLLMLIAVACDVPKPPPELPTATPGSQNPENVQSRLSLTPVRPTPDVGFTPLAAPPGYIYFARTSGLWRISPDGSGEKQLSSLPVSSPAQPSPDGSMVAWVSGRDLHVMPSAGGAAHKLYSGDLSDHQRLGWTADSASLGFMTYDVTTSGVEQAWSIPLAGGSPTLITRLEQAGIGRGPTYERSVQWSADGKWVVVGGVNNPMRLLRWPLSTSRQGDVRDIGGGEPDWSPDSRTLIYSETLNGALIVYDIIASEATPLRNENERVGTGLGEYSEGPGTRWSPASVGVDSDLFAYLGRLTADEPRVFVRRRGGLNLEPLPVLTNHPSWSPSGDRLVAETGYLKANTLGQEWESNGLLVADISFVGKHKITPLLKDAKWPVWGR